MMFFMFLNDRYRITGQRAVTINAKKIKNLKLKKFSSVCRSRSVTSTLNSLDISIKNVQTTTMPRPIVKYQNKKSKIMFKTLSLFVEYVNL